MVEIYRYIAADKPDAAEKVFAAVEQSVKLLTVNPHMGRLWNTRDPRLDGIRVYPVKPYRNYLIFYRAVGHDLEAFRIVNGARDLDQVVDEIELDAEDD